MFIGSLKTFKTIMILCFLGGLMGCGIRGAPIPPTKPNLYNQSYQEYADKKEKEDEQKNKFRGGDRPSHSL